MAHESFEDPPTAELLNENLVAIKVDREERPDVDAVYMAATQAMTGQGGWPMTVFMTPEGEPFYTGTYFPRDVFQRLVRGVAKAWHEDRDGVIGQAGRIAAALAERAAPLRGQTPEAGLSALCDQAVAALAEDYDTQRGGFGGAPKFPPSMVLEFLLRHSERPGGAESGGRALAMMTGTAHPMARGGMYDQLGGGFARYSVDADWVVPHFEKMLYDNALLARVYAHLWRRTGDPLARRVARETCAWMIRELRTPEGGFASALDADSEGEEGRFYTWTPAELTAVLGAAEGRYAAETWGVTEAGTFEHGRSVLQLRADPAEPDRYAAIRDALLAARERRVRPGRDDKVVAAWNGLAVSGLVDAGLRLDAPQYVAAAVRCASYLWDVHWVPSTGSGQATGRLRRVSRDGVVGAHSGVLEDYGCLATAYLDVAAGTADSVWLERARTLLDVAVAHFAAGDGGFFDTADDAEGLVSRPRDPADNASPSGLSSLVHALLGYAALTGSGEHRSLAERALTSVVEIARKAPRFAGWSLAGAEAALSGPV
jgi:uncharacterized protein YyaL (SSP411 family)